MRVCSFCGERNEDWMDICQRCGNSVVNAKVEYKAVRNTPPPAPVVNNNVNNKSVLVKEKKPIINLDLKIILVISLIILIALIVYTIKTIS